MKILLIICSMLALISTSFAQNIDPVTWTFSIEPTEKDATYTLVATANLAENWALYSQHTDPMGPVPTSFDIASTGIELKGDVEEVSSAIRKYSDLFEVETIKFKEKAVFRQVFTSTSAAPTISGTINYMTCDDTRCLPPKDKTFSVSL